MSRQDHIASDDAADTFVYRVTHDLRAHVRALRTIPDWIDEDLAEADISLPRDVAAHLSLMRDYANGLDAMLSALTDLSRVGRLADPSGPVDLWPMVLGLWDGISGASRFRLTVDGPDMQIFGPENDLSRLFQAVLDNVIDHHDQDRGNAHVSARADAGRVVIRIEDDGPGIADEFRTQVFTPLQTLRPRSETGRAGVGLAIARKVVMAQGGEIRLTDPDTLSGCAVEFDLPAPPT